MRGWRWVKHLLLNMETVGEGEEYFVNVIIFDEDAKHMEWQEQVREEKDSLTSKE